MRTWHIGGDRKRLHYVLSLLSNFLIQPSDDWEIVFRKVQHKRSVEQNKRYWVILNEIAETSVRGETYSAETWHRYFKVRFIGMDETKLPNGKVVQEPISTTTLDKGEFGEYMTRIEAWAAQHGILIADDRQAA